MKSSVKLGFLENYYKDIKHIFNKNSNEFKLVKVICLGENFKIKFTIHNIIEIFIHTLQQMLQDF